ncbi:MAG TPA: hypothetical protein VJY34_26630 [Roseiarcus sp.]|nr:hypothetical protein [Roseiarcus sp.]
MQKRLRGKIFAAARRAKRVAREQDELALLAEFMRHGSVAALAGAIAKRLGGGRARGANLIARADLDEGRDGR